MKLLTRFVAWLIGYYYEPCPVCGRYVAIMNNGRIVGWCSKRQHLAAARATTSPAAREETKP